MPARLHPRGCRDYGLGLGLGLGPAHPLHRDRDGVRWAVGLQALAGGMVPGAPRHPRARGAGATSGSLHLKKRVPPRYLHTLHSASPPAALVEYFYLSTRFPVCNPHGLQVPSSRGPSARGTLAASGSSHWVPAAPRGAEVLETPGIVPKRPFPAPLCSQPRGQRREVSQETSGGGTQRVFSSPEPQPAGSRILPQLSWETPGFRGTAWHCRRLLEEGWSWAG